LLLLMWKAWMVVNVLKYWPRPFHLELSFSCWWGDKTLERTFGIFGSCIIVCII
jgi:hypothetical protein